MYSALGSSIPNYVIRPQGIVGALPLSQSELIVAGEYQDLLESPDGKWLLAIKGGKTTPQTLVRIELTTRQETVVHFAVTGKLQLLAVIPGANKFLFAHHRSANAGQAYVLTPTTGAVERVRGDYRPLPRLAHQNFQSTGKADEVWAAAYNPKTNATDVGRDNLQTFSFTPLTSLPNLRFTSRDLWVEEAGKAMYIVYRHHLLRVSLKP